MNCSTYRKILEGYGDMDSVKRAKLLRVYLHIPSLPKLRAVRALLVKLKTTDGNSSLLCFSNRK